MPSHALPRGPDVRARARAARRRDVRRAHQAAPVSAAGLTGIVLAHPLLPAGHHSVLTELFIYAGLALLGALIVAFLMVGAVLLDERARKLSQRQAGPRPRAQYALLILGRALSRGRIRPVFWWHQPLWLFDGTSAVSEN